MRPTFNWREPWVIEAQEMRAKGLIRRTVAKMLGRSIHQIRMADDLKYAAYQRAKARRRNAAKRAQ